MTEYIKTLEYYFEDESHVIFNKYTINALDGIIKHKKSGWTLSYGIGLYNRCSVTDDIGKVRSIRVSRAVASTFLGKPPTPEHTADHIESKQKKNDALANIRWNCRPGQRDNQIRSETNKTAFIVVNDGIEKTMKEWVKHMNAVKMPEDREFTQDMIKYYAQSKQRGFAYKEYPDLEGEKWEEIKGSKNTQGRWEISNMNRVKYATKHADNVLWGERLGHSNGYPTIMVNGKQWLCHILAFKIFHEELWDAKKPEEIVRHEDDDKEDFRPHKLKLGTASGNTKDSYDNGKRDGTKTARMRCVSYIDGVLEKDHDSQSDAAKYLKSKECYRVSIESIVGDISMALSGKLKTAYGRTWQKIR
ncbi:hypothetical protein PBCVNW6652_917R [Paramecium bursaria Chlorella virus NW665.2]|nr:hypothetical protein PBCVNW6652_917R [Paramecium bursaria Chlorella virus NW665.2]